MADIKVGYVTISFALIFCSHWWVNPFEREDLELRKKIILLTVKKQLYFNVNHSEMNMSRGRSQFLISLPLKACLTKCSPIFVISSAIALFSRLHLQHNDIHNNPLSVGAEF